jgi:hypothetical protein
MILQLLHDEELIAWKRDKTNYDYARELRPHPDHRSFLQLTRSFELIWYGERKITERDYRILSPVFSRFISNIRKHERTAN